MSDSEGPIQVYVVTSGVYSDYGISSIWLSLEEATAEAADWGRVEVWPIGTNQRTLGNFHMSGDFDATTGKPLSEHQYEDSTPEGERISVACWPGRTGRLANRIGIRVNAETQERANKVYSEVRARVLSEIALGLPADVIANTKYVNGEWQPTKSRKTQKVSEDDH